MKKAIFPMLLAAILSVAMAGCTANAISPLTDGEPGPYSMGQSTQEDSTSEAADQPAGDGLIQALPAEGSTSTATQGDVDDTQVQTTVRVADAPLYRGTVTQITEDENGRTLTLEQAPGTDFGAPELQVLLDSSTQYSFELEALKEGVYLEVQVGVAPGEQLDPAQVQTAITANLYPTAEMVLFNGRLESITPDPDKDGKGRMLLTELETNQQVVFHYSENTQFYLQVEELAQGDTLNILHRGAMTRSLPPQGSALEVRPYAEPAV